MLRTRRYVLALTAIPLAVSACHLGGAPGSDLQLSVVNRTDQTETVTISGAARYTLSVHSCAGSGVFLAHGTYSITIDGGPKSELLDLAVPLSSGAPPSRVIVIAADGSIDWDSDANPNDKAC